MIHHAREYEQEIRQPVDVSQEDGVDGRRQRDHAALGPPAHRAGEMERGARCGTAGQNESLEGRKLRLERVDDGFEMSDMRLVERRLRHAAGDSIGRVRELRAKSKQVALNANERFVEVAVNAGRTREPEPRVQFVDFAVGVDERFGLAHAGLIEE